MMVDINGDDVPMGILAISEINRSDPYRLRPTGRAQYWIDQREVTRSEWWKALYKCYYHDAECEAKGSEDLAFCRCQERRDINEKSSANVE
jgi:hypothetical protein